MTVKGFKLSNLYAFVRQRLREADKTVYRFCPLIANDATRKSEQGILKSVTVILQHLNISAREQWKRKGHSTTCYSPYTISQLPELQICRFS